MRDLEANKTLIYYSNVSADTDITDTDSNYTGETETTYSTPTPIKLHISSAKGTYNRRPFGDIEEYDRVITSASTDLPITKTTVFWIDRPIRESGVRTRHDYEVYGISKSINGVQIALKKVAT